MSFFRKLFGGADAGAEKPAESDPVEYKGYSIRATPFKEAGQYQCCGIITKEIAGETKQHRFIRADKFSSLDDAFAITLRKGQQIVDEQGDRMFS